MAMDFEIPDITENAGKAATGRKQRKPRKAGTLRLGETLRQISHNYTATRESEDEDKHVEFYSLSEGPEKFDFYGTEVSIVGVCVRNKKTAAIYMELPSGNRADFIKTVAKSEGEPQDAAGMTIFADTVTSLFITKPQKGENVVTIALMDSEDAKALSNNAAIEEREAEEKKGISHKIIKTWFDPVGRMSRKTYIKRMPGMLIPSIILFVITVLRPELFVGEANPFIVGFLILGTLWPAQCHPYGSRDLLHRHRSPCFLPGRGEEEQVRAGAERLKIVCMSQRIRNGCAYLIRSGK